MTDRAGHSRSRRQTQPCLPGVRPSRQTRTVLVTYRESCAETHCGYGRYYLAVTARAAGRRGQVNPGGLISDVLIGMLPGDGLGIDPGTWLVYLRSYVR